MLGLIPGLNGRSFLIGLVAGGALLGAGLFLGGAQRARPGHGGSSPDAHFGVLSAQRLDIVDGRGRVQMRLRGNHENGGNLRVFDRSGDVRVELRADGTLLTYGGNERVRARLGRDRLGGDRRAGALELFDTHGRLTTRLPHLNHDAGCGCETCSGAYRPWDDRDHHDHDRHDHDDHYDDGYVEPCPTERPRPSRPWWRDE